MQYPKTVILANGDTVVALTKKQAKQINKIHEKHLGLKKEVDLLKKQLSLQDSINHDLKNQIWLQEKNKKHFQEWLINKNEQINLVEKEKKALMGEVRKYRRQRNGVAGGCAGFLLLLLLI